MSLSSGRLLIGSTRESSVTAIQMPITSRFCPAFVVTNDITARKEREKWMPPQQNTEMRRIPSTTIKKKTINRKIRHMPAKRAKTHGLERILGVANIRLSS